MEYDEENYLTLNVYGEKGDIEEFKRRLSRECYAHRLAYRLTKAPKDEWSDPRQEYIVGYFNGMAAGEPNTPDITDIRSFQSIHTFRPHRRISTFNASSSVHTHLLL